MLLRACKTPNFGDSINVPLFKYITGESPIIVNNIFSNPYNVVIYMVCGSVLGWADRNTIVWGSGLLSDTVELKEPPKKILAVRGKLTRERLLKMGIECSEVYGDPALLYSKFYKVTMKKRYGYGIIPHHIDKDLIEQLKKQFPNMLIIDIQGEINEVIAQVLSCKGIISSALHGLIIADAYNIPNIWLKLSDKVLGHGFKYRDYFSSVNREDIEPLIWTPQITLKDIKNKFEKYTPPEIDLKLLWEACPFKKDKL